MTPVVLIDYGAGNLNSVRKGFAAVGADLATASVLTDLHRAAAIVVPGVGHFAATMGLAHGWREAIIRRVEAGVPILGICLGMQWLFEGSEEAPEVPGLGWLPGRCTRLAAERPLKVPHVGWNTLDVRAPAGILANVEPGSSVYFTHSYAAPVTADCVAECRHGQTFAAAVQRGHVAGVQFHPEKSGEAGLQILRSFAAMARH